MPKKLSTDLGVPPALDLKTESARKVLRELIQVTRLSRP